MNGQVILASADAGLRRNLTSSLSSLRWTVREAGGGAEVIAYLEASPAEALILDTWLPDLEVGALAEVVKQLYPATDLVRVDGSIAGENRSARRNELLYALREAQRMAEDRVSSYSEASVSRRKEGCGQGAASFPVWAAQLAPTTAKHPASRTVEPIAGLIGASAPMCALVRLIRLVARHEARVLIEGETGTGKELVAKALHTLSPRVNKPFVVLNCAAIPEALLEAELFGHTRGAFTGAVQSRVGRIEAAHGGTLFLDEIGEMPLLLQAKLLRFLENGELQRVGDNETVRVDVRVIAATHRLLDERARDGEFRLDLLHRLAVFPIEVPSLRDRLEDLPLLAEHFLSEFGKQAPRKQLHAKALEKLYQHDWPGNVRELGHVLQRAAILAGMEAEISEGEIAWRRSRRT